MNKDIKSLSLYYDKDGNRYEVECVYMKEEEKDKPRVKTKSTVYIPSKDDEEFGDQFDHIAMKGCKSIIDDLEDANIEVDDKYFIDAFVDVLKVIR